MISLIVGTILGFGQKNPIEPVTIEKIVEVINKISSGSGSESDWNQLITGKSTGSVDKDYQDYFIRFERGPLAEKSDPYSWAYSTVEQQKQFRQRFLSLLKLPFKNYNEYGNWGQETDIPVTSSWIKLEESIDGLFVGCNTFYCSVDFTTGRITDLELMIGWKPLREKNSIRLESVEKEIRQDGPYDSKTESERWVPISWSEKEPSGRSLVVKTRIFRVKRGSYVKSYWFRYNGDFFMTTDNKPENGFYIPDPTKLKRKVPGGKSINLK